MPKTKPIDAGKRMKTAKGDTARWLKHGVEFESIYIVGEFAVGSVGKFSNVERRAVETYGPFMLARSLLLREIRTDDRAEAAGVCGSGCRMPTIEFDR